jgi:hypothetical protein
MEAISYVYLFLVLQAKSIPNPMTSTPEITIRLVLPDSVAVNSQVKGALEITNTGDKKIELVSPSYNAALNLVVFDRLWNQVTANSLDKAHIAYERFELSPGQTTSIELADLTFTTGTSRMRHELKSGIYYVLAVYHPGTAKLPEESTYPFAIASNVRKLVVN